MPCLSRRPESEGLGRPMTGGGRQVAAVVPSPTRASHAERGQPSTRACTPFLPRRTLIWTTLSQVQARRAMGMPRVGATLLKAAEETSSPEARNVVAY